MSIVDPALAKTGTLADQAYEALASSIISGELPPGMRMLEVELAERFGMSRGPLREAMRRLEERRRHPGSDPGGRQPIAEKDSHARHHRRHPRRRPAT